MDDIDYEILNGAVNKISLLAFVKIEAILGDAARRESETLKILFNISSQGLETVYYYFDPSNMSEISCFKRGLILTSKGLYFKTRKGEITFFNYSKIISWKFRKNKSPNYCWLIVNKIELGGFTMNIEDQILFKNLLDCFQGSRQVNVYNIINGLDINGNKLLEYLIDRYRISRLSLIKDLENRILDTDEILKECDFGIITTNYLFLSSLNAIHKNDLVAFRINKLEEIVDEIEPMDYGESMRKDPYFLKKQMDKSLLRIGFEHGGRYILRKLFQTKTYKYGLELTCKSKSYTILKTERSIDDVRNKIMEISREFNYWYKLNLPEKTVRKTVLS